MQVEKQELKKSQVELIVELSLDEFKSYIEKGVIKVSGEVKIEGFRPGKVPYEILKQKIGEMTILEEAGRLAINGTLDKVLKDNITGQPVGSPQIEVTKLAPDNPFAYKVTLAMIPGVEMGEYKDLKIKQKTVAAEEAEVDKMINDLREMRAQEVAADRAIIDSDKVIVDMQMFLDSVPVEGGQSTGTAVIIGKDYIIPGFDKQLVGAKKNETREFSLPYPKDFHMKNLAGKMVEFKVTIKDVFERKLPPLDETFAQGFGLKQVEELKINIKKSIEQQKNKESTQVAERDMLEKIITSTKFGELPEMLINSEAKNMMHELEHTVKEQGGKFEDYLTSLNKTKDQMMLDLLPEAVKRVKISLVLRELAKKEGVKVEDKEIEAYLENLQKAQKDNKEALEQIKTPEYRAYVINLLTSRKVIDKLREWNIVK